MVLLDEINAGIVADADEDERLMRRRLFSDQLVLVHHWGIRQSESQRHHQAIPDRLRCWLCLSGTSRILVFTGKMVPDRLVEMGSSHAILACVAAGMGIGLVPRRLVESHPSQSLLGLHKIPRRHQPGVPQLGLEEWPT